MGAPETANITSNPFRIDPRDPSYDEGPEIAECEALEYICNEVKGVIARAEALLAEGKLDAAAKLLAPLDGVI